MAMTYDETSELTKNVPFQGRVAVACVHFADYIAGEDPATPAHSTRIKWAQQTLLNPQPVVQACIWTVCNDSAVQDAGGAAITDDALQGAVETSINKLL
jgi:hypothetical protein